MKLKISDITIEKIKNNEFVEEIPELYELKHIIENNRSHVNDPVFEHTIAVLVELQKLIAKANNKIKNHLNQKIGTKTRWELLFLAAVFHDIAKKETFIKEGEITSCPEHEKQGAEKTEKILERFDMSKEEKQFVVKIIRSHGILHTMLGNRHGGLNLDYEFNKFKSEFKDIALEIIVLSLADLLGIQLRETDPEDFKFRIKFCKDALEGFSG